MDESGLLIFAVVAAALFFDFTNGWNDSANAIATVVSTRVLRPGTAILLAAVLNLLGALVSERVAKTISTGLIVPGEATQAIVLAAMIAAAIWVAAMTLIGLPISGSHSLIGSLVGAALARGGLSIVQGAGLRKVLEAMLLSPLLGFGLGFLIMGSLLWLLRRQRPHDVQSWFGKLQLVSVSFMAWQHGTNDAQKVMGVITLALVAGGYQQSTDVQTWVMLSCGLAISIGTAAGGWKVIRTLGSQLIKIQPVHGFAAETAAGITLGTAAWLGVPVSTTHTITGAIMGVGATRRLSAVRWGLGSKILVAWVFTLPCCAALAWTVYMLLHMLTGIA